MRTLNAQTVIDAVAKLSMDANRYLPADVHAALKRGYETDTSPVAKEIFRQLLENAALAEESGLALCQDTGLAILFVEMGEDLRVEGGLRPALDEGVRKGYREGYLRKSVCDPLSRANTGDNTPSLVHLNLVPGDKLKISLLAKGGGSENMSRVTMLSPSQGIPGIKQYVINRVAEAGPNPCPPVIVGIGIGGSFDTVASLAKTALMRSLDDVNPNPQLADLEADLLKSLNKLGIGPMGLGGDITCLGVKAAMAPCHIASLPLAVNIQCHSARHKEVVL